MADASEPAADAGEGSGMLEQIRTKLASSELEPEVLELVECAAPLALTCTARLPRARPDARAHARFNAV